MIEYYTNESAAHLLLSMTRIVEKPEDCEALRKCLNKAVEKEFDGSICYCERPLYVRRQAI